MQNISIFKFKEKFKFKVDEIYSIKDTYPDSVTAMISLVYRSLIVNYFFNCSILTAMDNENKKIIEENYLLSQNSSLI